MKNNNTSTLPHRFDAIRSRCRTAREALGSLIARVLSGYQFPESMPESFPIKSPRTVRETVPSQDLCPMASGPEGGDIHLLPSKQKTAITSQCGRFSFFVKRHFSPHPSFFPYVVAVAVVVLVDAIAVAIAAVVYVRGGR